MSVQVPVGGNPVRQGVLLDGHAVGRDLPRSGCVLLNRAFKVFRHVLSKRDNTPREPKKKAV